MSLMKILSYLYVCWVHTFSLCGQQEYHRQLQRGLVSDSAGRQKAQEAGKKAKVNVGAGMVVRRKTTAAATILNIYNKRATKQNM